MTEKIKIPENFWRELQEVYEEAIEPDNKIFIETEKLIKSITKDAKLLVESKRISNKENPLFLEFSLFEPMGRGQDEVHYTKTLVWFMDKSKNHGFKSGVLEALWPVLNYENDLKYYDRYTVRSELSCGEHRLDMAIMDGDSIKIAIEAKINAKEGHKTSSGGKRSIQLKEYDKWLNKNPKHKNCKRIFLVKDSESKTSSGKWQVITWRIIAEKMILFLDNPKSKRFPGYNFLKLFTASIIRDVDRIHSESDILGAASYIKNMMGDENGNNE